MGDDKKRERKGKSLDLTSDQFDAHRALYSRNVTLPSPKAPILDNLTKFSEAEGGIFIKKTCIGKVQDAVKGQPSTSESPRYQPSTSESSRFQPSTSGSSRFQPHQQPITSREKTIARNVLTRMTNVKGPLSLLQRCMNERIRIKVVTRNMVGIRGYCLGYLLAFDKHFNLALEDVTEVWTRKKHIKSPPLGPCYDLYVPIPRIKFRSIDSKTEECERFVSKLMMRGEHVVIVIASDH